MHTESNVATVEPAEVRRLAALLGVFVFICDGPAVIHFNLALAPNWARLLFLGGGLLFVYVAWLALVPCRETLWSVMWAFAIAAAGAALAMAVLLFTPAYLPMPLGLGDSRMLGVAWSAIVAALLSLASVLTAKLNTTSAPGSRQGHRGF